MFQLHRAVHWKIFGYPSVFQKNNSIAGVQNELIIMRDNNGGVCLARYRID